MLQIFRSHSAVAGTLAALLLSGQLLAQTKARQSRTPVLVELFTAEGCSSCPPADALLAQLVSTQPVDDVEIIALGEHVDYWDQLGWRDRFSSHQFTDRQNAYRLRFGIDSVYTPQMVVNGTEQFVGNDAVHARSAITRAGKATRINLALANPISDGHRATISVSLASPASPLPKADLYAALVDPSDTTDIKGGENRGIKLHHVAVVRSLQRIGKLESLAQGPIKTTLTAPQGAVLQNMRVIVFAQRSGTGPVVGATSIAMAQ
jgi:hypothetical protein